MNGMGMGREVGRQLMQQVQAMAIQTELIYSLVIILCSLMVYFGTKELYKLTSHKGIKYFRLSFLFFAIAYFFRSFIIVLLSLFQIPRILDLSPRVLGIFALSVFMYTSSMAIFCLLYSVMWKKFKNPNIIFFFHLLAVVFSVITISVEEVRILLGLQILLFAFVVFTSYLAHKNLDKNKKKHNMYIIYVLLFGFWILNIIDILIPNSFGIFQLLIYIFSISIFMTILYKVLRKAGN